MLLEQDGSLLVKKTFSPVRGVVGERQARQTVQASPIPFLTALVSPFDQSWPEIECFYLV